MTFNAFLENWAEGMDYCAIAVPDRITQKLGTKKAVLVMARLNGCSPFQVSLFPAGGGKHFIRIRQKIRKQEGLSEGDKVKVEIEVLDRSKVELPRDLVSALKKKKALDKFNNLTPGKKNYAVRKINEAVRPDTREKRITDAVELALNES